MKKTDEIDKLSEKRESEGNREEESYDAAFDVKFEKLENPKSYPEYSKNQYWERD